MERENGPTRLRFGVFELDLRTGELRKSGVRLKLDDQPFRILRALVVTPGDLVTRQQLQDDLWPDESFGDLDHRLNAAVKRLRDTLSDSATSPRYVETLPRKGYRFIAPVEALEDEREAVDPVPPPPPKPWRWLALGLGALLVVAAWLAIPWEPKPEPPRDFKRVRLTVDPGVERHASLSPDGNWVAYEGGSDRYVANGTARGEADIYVALTDPGAAPPIRVTNIPGVDTQPTWSPDGKQLAFVHILESRGLTAGTTYKLMLAPPIEGAPVTELTSRTFVGRHPFVCPAWSPDGRYLAFQCRIEETAIASQICLYSIDRDETWPLTSPAAPPGDLVPVFAPDGASIAFYRNEAAENGLYLQDLNEDMRPEGKPRYLGPAGARSAWSRNGPSLYFTRLLSGLDEGLFKIRPSAEDEATLVRQIDGFQLSLWDGPSGELRIAYEERIRKSEIVLIDLRDPKSDGAPTLPFADAEDHAPQFSPDGKTLAFRSNRTARNGLWLWDLSEKPPHLLREVGGSFVASRQPAWSPDGTRIVTEGAFEGGRNAVIDVRTGRIGAQFDGLDPSWDHDGESFYHSSLGPDKPTIWKLDPETGEKHELVAGAKPRESSDGRRLYFVQTRTRELMAVALDANGIAGEPERIAQDVGGSGAFSAVPGGVYFRARKRPEDEVYKYSEESGRTELVTTLPGSTIGGLSVSSDERWLAYTRQVSSASDIWMLEGVE